MADLEDYSFSIVLNQRSYETNQEFTVADLINNIN
jgi:sulfur carrier protein ThiS